MQAPEQKMIMQGIQSASAARFKNEIMYVVDNGKYAESDGKSRGLYSLYTTDFDSEMHFSVNVAWKEPFLHCYFGAEEHIACFGVNGKAALVARRREDEDMHVHKIVTFDTNVHDVWKSKADRITRIEPSCHGDRNTVFLVSAKHISRMQFMNNGETSSVVHEKTENMQVLDIAGVDDNVVAATVKAASSRKTTMCLFDSRMQKSVAAAVNAEGSPLSVACMSYEKNMVIYLKKEKRPEDGAETNMFMAGYENGELAIYDIRMAERPAIRRCSKAQTGVPGCSRLWADAAPWYTGMLCDKTGVVVFNNKLNRYTEIGVPVHENRKHEVDVMFRAEHCFVLFPSSMSSKPLYNSLDLFAIPISTL
jgi:hypothetical protein